MRYVITDSEKELEAKRQRIAQLKGELNPELAPPTPAPAPLQISPPLEGQTETSPSKQPEEKTKWQQRYETLKHRTQIQKGKAMSILEERQERAKQKEIELKAAGHKRLEKMIASGETLEAQRKQKLESKIAQIESAGKVKEAAILSAGEKRKAEIELASAQKELELLEERERLRKKVESTTTSVKRGLKRLGKGLWKAIKTDPETEKPVAATANPNVIFVPAKEQPKKVAELKKQEEKEEVKKPLTKQEAIDVGMSIAAPDASPKPYGKNPEVLVSYDLPRPANAIKFLNVPHVANGFPNSCSETSAEMILRYWGVKSFMVTLKNKCEFIPLNQFTIHEKGYQTFEGGIAEGDIGLMNMLCHEQFADEKLNLIKFHVEDNVPRENKMTQTAPKTRRCKIKKKEGTIALLKHFIDQDIPVIIRYETNSRGDRHTVVLIGYNDKGFWKHDNDMGASLFVPLKEFERGWLKTYIAIWPA